MLALTFGVAMAQTPPALTLDDCLRIALSENPTVKVADMEIERLDYSKRKLSDSCFRPLISEPTTTEW